MKWESDVFDAARKNVAISLVRVLTRGGIGSLDGSTLLSDHRGTHVLCVDTYTSKTTMNRQVIALSRQRETTSYKPILLSLARIPSLRVEVADITLEEWRDEVGIDIRIELASQKALQENRKLIARTSLYGDTSDTRMSKSTSYH